MPSRPEGIKMCNQCGEELPATSDYFDIDSSKEDGFKTICRSCRLGVIEEASRDRRDKRLQVVDDAAFRMLADMASGREGTSIPHLSELYQRVMEVFGGAGGYAQHLMAQYLAASPGSSVRTKILESILRMSQELTRVGAAELEADQLSDIDLQITMRRLGGFRGLPKYVDGTVEKTP